MDTYTMEIQVSEGPQSSENLQKSVFYFFSRIFVQNIFALILLLK
jgi:hypothetical protein